MKLTKRLEVIGSLVEKNSILADIGTDHGYLPVYLIENNIISKAIASDVNQGPVNNAKRTVEDNNMMEAVSVRLGSGLSTLKEDDGVNTVVIAGMGGSLISQLLEEEEKLAKSVDKLILQPMTTKIELRKYLISNGYTIIEEKIAIEGEKIYEIIVACSGKSCPWEEIYYDIGKKFDVNSEDYGKFISAKLNKYKSIASTIIEKGGEKSTAKLNEIQKKIEIIESIISQRD